MSSTPSQSFKIVKISFATFMNLAIMVLENIQTKICYQKSFKICDKVCNCGDSFDSLVFIVKNWYCTSHNTLCFSLCAQLYSACGRCVIVLEIWLCVKWREGPPTLWTSLGKCSFCSSERYYMIFSYVSIGSHIYPVAIYSSQAWWSTVFQSA